MNEVIMHGCQKVLENIMSGYGNHEKNIEFTTSDKFNIFLSNTITTSDIFQYFSTAMHDSHSLILNMIQQIEKK